MVILHSQLKVELYGCMIRIRIAVEIQFLIKQLLQVMLLHQLIVELELQELQLSILDEIISILYNSVPKRDTGTGTAGTANVYASATHQHPLNVDPTTANVTLVNATAAANGSSDYYCGSDDVHPQQLTYVGNVTETKFIKSEQLATEVLCANGDTTTLDKKLSRTYSGIGQVRLCVFPAGAGVDSPFIESKVYSSYNAVQIIRFQPNYTVNGINTAYGIFTAPTKISIGWLHYDSGV
ncbi:MAG: hypothetical protein EZS28_011229 [Streblomastix strix]|uniref:Uncharacterized protein n=1 Tax=Streblomastix strix TaxID=222440 RepID=A0A5J4WEV6_9EUKA|nr:MAG: hypothetical protein EZS28_011229 [Streblomastix strix]